MTDSAEPIKRGRKSKEEEAWSFLADKGITPDILEQLQAATTDGVLPGTFQELEESVRLRLASMIPTLQGTALVQAARTIRALADEERRGGGPEQEAEPLIADVVSGVASLPVARRKEILAAERSRLEQEIAAIDAALEAANVDVPAPAAS